MSYTIERILGFRAVPLLGYCAVALLGYCVVRILGFSANRWFLQINPNMPAREHLDYNLISRFMRITPWKPLFTTPQSWGI